MIPRQPILKLTLLLEGFTYPLPVSIMIYIFILSGGGTIPASHFWIAILTAAVSALTFSLFLRYFRLNPLFKKLEKEQLSNEEAHDIKTALLNYPRREFYNAAQRLIAIPLVALILSLLGTHRVEIYVVSIFLIISGLLVSFFFLAQTEIFLSSFLRLDSLSKVIVKKDRIKTFGILGKSAITLTFLVVYPVSVFSAIFYLLTKGIVQIEQLKTILTVILVILAPTIGIAIYAFTKSMRKSVENSSKAINSLSKGYIDAAKIPVISGDQIGLICQDLNSLNGVLHKSILSIKNVSSQVATGSLQFSQSSQHISDGAAQQASTVEEISSSLEEMSSSVESNAANAKSTEELADKVAKEAQRSGEAVSLAVDAVRQITHKITMIEGIARNTNMLALNAAIEAARVGQTGKGFAVVASEIRKLAENSQKVAGEIGELSLKTTEYSEQAGELLESLVPGVEKTAEHIQDISASSAEQALGIKQVTQAVSQLDRVIQQNAAVSEEVSMTAEQFSREAQRLNAEVGFFKVEESAAHPASEHAR